MTHQFLGLGDNVVDMYTDTKILYPGGQALNFAVYAKMLNQPSAYLGVFGDDAHGDYVRSVATELGVDIAHCPIRHGENGYAKVTHENGDRIFLYSNKGGISREEPLVIQESQLEYIRQFSLIHTSANGRVDDQLPTLHATGIPISYDFSVRFAPETLTAICPYLTFAVMSCGHLTVEETREAIALAHQSGAENVIATRGEEGSFFFDGLETHFCPTTQVTPLDTLGAGDSYLTAFMASYIPYYHSNRDSRFDDLEGHRTAVHAAMEAGSQFAAKNVMVHGAFGFGLPFSAQDLES